MEFYKKSPEKDSLIILIFFRPLKISNVCFTATVCLSRHFEMVGDTNGQLEIFYERSNISKPYSTLYDFPMHTTKFLQRQNKASHFWDAARDWVKLAHYFLAVTGRAFKHHVCIPSD